MVTRDTEPHCHYTSRTLRVLSFGMIRIRINDPRSLRSWCTKGTDESTLDKDPSVSLMHHDPNDLGSVITDPDLDHPKGTHPNMLLPA